MQDKLTPSDPEYFAAIWRQDPENAPTESTLSSWINTSGKKKEWKQAFSGFVSFGTGGLRAKMGIGTTRMNNFTIKRVARGVVHYLQKSSPNQHSTVYIGYDTRLHSKEFAHKFAEILAENEHHVYMSPHFCPTPLTAFAVRELGCSMGIMITASHNPKEYNGCKLYSSAGAQITAPVDKEIAACINNNLHLLPSASTKKKATIDVSPFLEEKFIAACLNLFWCSPIEPTPSPLQVVYSPLHGTGTLLFQKGLKSLGFPSPSVVVQQNTPDPFFPTVPVPNPENDSTLSMGISQLQKEEKDLLFVMDPDADRVRVVVNHQGNYIALTGNQIGVILADFLCQQMQKKQLKYDALVTTVVSTPMLQCIAKKYGLHCIETLVGFKNIAQEILTLEKHGKRCLMAMEESYGYLLGDHIYEKDGFTATFALSICAQHLKNQGTTLVHYLQDLYKTFGYFSDAQKLWTFPNLDRVSLTALRQTPPQYIGDKRVIKTIDYQLGVSHLRPCDMLEYQVEYGVHVLIRFSGTEPKIKIYIHTRTSEDKKEKAVQNLQNLLTGVEEFKALIQKAS